jgi:tol-pal system protein YbgF
MTKRILAPVAIGLVLALTAQPALVHAQDVSALVDRLERIERDIRTLNVQISRGEAPAAGAAASTPGVPGEPMPKFAAARLTQRMDNLEQDLRAATGAQESLDHRLAQIAERLDKLVGDIDYRLGAIEGRLGLGGAPQGQTLPTGADAGTQGFAPQAAPAAPGGQARTIAAVPAGTSVAPAATAQPAPAAQPGTLGTVSAKAVEEVQAQRGGDSAAAAAPAQQPAPAAQPAPTQQAAATLPAGTPKEQDTYAFNLLRQTNYDQAEIALKQFIAEHGDHALAGNARYWLGETFYVRADFQQAAQVFFDGFQSDPKGPKAPDMLLKLGMSLAQLNKKTEACATYDKVAADFAQSSSRIKTALERERQRAGCQ